jgi:hypothetical protein
VVSLVSWVNCLLVLMLLPLVSAHGWCMVSSPQFQQLRHVPWVGVLYVGPLLKTEPCLGSWVPGGCLAH